MSHEEMSRTSSISYPFLSSSRRSILRKTLSDYLSSSSPSSEASQNKPLKILWSSTPNWIFSPNRTSGSTSRSNSKPISLAVLDSSFNPPTSAHLSLLLNHPGSPDESYDSHLLLFSTLNADKGRGKKGDASPLQRIELMEILAKEALQRLRSKRPKNNANVKDIKEEREREREQEQEDPSIAIGIVDQPLIATKSTIIHQYLRENLDPQSQSQVVLHYLVGADTLPRFFNPKYYNPSNGEGLRKTCENLFGIERTKLICSRRLMIQENELSPSSEGEETRQEMIQKKLEEERKKEQELLNSHHVREWYERGFIEIHNLLDLEEMQFSSTEIRKLAQTLVRPVKDQEGIEKLEERLQSCTVEGVRDYILTEKVYTGQDEQ